MTCGPDGHDGGRLVVGSNHQLCVPAVPGRPATVSLETEQCWQSAHGDPSVPFHLHVGVRDTGPCESSDVFIEGGR